MTVFASTHIVGLSKHKLHYIKHFMGPVLWLAPMMLFIEIIGHMARPVSLSLRLFGNIKGEDLVVLILFMLVPLAVPAVMLPGGEELARSGQTRVDLQEIPAWHTVSAGEDEICPFRLLDGEVHRRISIAPGAVVEHVANAEPGVGSQACEAGSDFAPRAVVRDHQLEVLVALTEIAPERPLEAIRVELAAKDHRDFHSPSSLTSMCRAPRVRGIL